MMGMHMSFWFGSSLEPFLFDGYDITSSVGLLFTCLALVSLGILFEGVRLKVQRLAVKQRSELQLNLHGEVCPNECDPLLRDEKGTAKKVSALRKEWQDFLQQQRLQIRVKDDPRSQPMWTASVQLSQQPSGSAVWPQQHSDEPVFIHEPQQGGWPESLCYTVVLHIFQTNNRHRHLGVQVMWYTVQTVLSYVLMLSVMTYNAYLALSVVAGAGLGYLVFGPAFVEVELCNSRQKRDCPVCISKVEKANQLEETSAVATQVAEGLVNSVSDESVEHDNVKTHPVVQVHCPET